MNDDVIAAKPSAEMLDYLLKRRSVPILNIGDPGPDKAQIETILKAASRVPDHGKMFPWYFIVFEGDAREKIGDALEKAWLSENPDAAPAKIELERGRFMRAPLVIAVISRIRKGKKPLWEQILSSGAACYNLCLAANALGYGTNWVTEWYAYNDVFRKELGLDGRDHVAGFIYIGTPKQPPEERPRPELDQIVTYWQPGATPNKGANYGYEEMGFPAKQFDFENLD